MRWESKLTLPLCWWYRSRESWQLLCLRLFNVSVMTHISDFCYISLLTLVECTHPWVNRGRWWFVRRGSRWRNLPHVHLQHGNTPSLQLSQQRACHWGNRILGGLQTCHQQSTLPDRSDSSQQKNLGSVSPWYHCISYTHIKAATTLDCSSISFWKTYCARVFSRYLKQVHISNRCLVLCVTLVYT